MAAPGIMAAARTDLSALEVHADPTSLARAAAEHFVAQAAEAIAARSRFLVALAGGSTPRATYALLATDAFASRIDWSRVCVFWGDERCVPPDHADSNYRMTREVLLDHVPISTENVHRIAGELDPAQAAASYERELKTAMGADGRLDLVLLGLGSDGHTASLFPDTAALEERERWVAANYVERLGAWRITLTLPTINKARQVTFLVAGPSKAEPLVRIRAGADLPAGLVQPEEGQLTWLVDRGADRST
jgi:6-phosphogluconolactonase